MKDPQIPEEKLLPFRRITNIFAIYYMSELLCEQKNLKLLGDRGWRGSLLV